MTIGLLLVERETAVRVSSVMSWTKKEYIPRDRHKTSKHHAGQDAEAKNDKTAETSRRGGIPNSSPVWTGVVECIETLDCACVRYEYNKQGEI